MRKVDREARLSFFHPPDLSRPSPSSAAPATKKCTNHKKKRNGFFSGFQIFTTFGSVFINF